MKIATIVGARPQFIKAAVVSRALRKFHTEFTIHTGQHYDDNMSGVFFRELEMDPPRYTLGIGSMGHGAQTGAMLSAIEETLLRDTPDIVLVYGDTNSTLAGALAAAKLHIPIAHVEAGLRSFNRRMPEEINRVLTDHLSSLLFAPSEASKALLNAEGISKGVFVVGDVMLDAALKYAKSSTTNDVLANLAVERGRFILCTLHRAETTDIPERLAHVLSGVGSLELPVILPLHPRTRARVDACGLTIPRNVRALEPLGYPHMIALTESAAAVVTDSGGLQKEAFFLGTPCVTVRNETEWVETVQLGWNVLCDPDNGDVSESLAEVLAQKDRARPPVYGDGHASERIAELLANFTGV